MADSRLLEFIANMDPGYDESYGAQSLGMVPQWQIPVAPELNIADVLVDKWKQTQQQRLNWWTSPYQAMTTQDAIDMALNWSQMGLGVLPKSNKLDQAAASLRVKAEGLLDNLTNLTKEFDQIGQRTYVVPEAYKIQPPIQNMVSEDVLGQVITGVKDTSFSGKTLVKPDIQQKISDMLEQGLSGKQISKELRVSQETVKNVKNIMGISDKYSQEATTRFATLRGPSKISITEEQFAEQLNDYAPYLGYLSKRFGDDGTQEGTQALWRSLNDNPDKSKTWHKIEMWNAAQSIEKRGISIDTARHGRTYQPVRILPPENAPADEWLSAVVNAKHLSPEDSYIDAMDMQRFAKSLTPVERDYYRLREEGFVDREIANIWKLKLGNTSKLFKELKDAIADKIKKIMMIAAPVGAGLYSGAAQMEN